MLISTLTEAALSVLTMEISSWRKSSKIRQSPDVADNGNFTTNSIHADEWQRHEPCAHKRPFYDKCGEIGRRTPFNTSQRVSAKRKDALFSTIFKRFEVIDFK